MSKHLSRSGTFVLAHSGRSLRLTVEHPGSIFDVDVYQGCLDVLRVMKPVLPGLLKELERKGELKVGSLCRLEDDPEDPKENMVYEVARQK